MNKEKQLNNKVELNTFEQSTLDHLQSAIDSLMQTAALRGSQEKARQNIARSNSRFQKMTKKQKRIAIAKDVIAQLKIGTISGEDSTWGDFKLRDGIRFEDVKDKELSDVLSNSVESCNACALGGLFIGAVNVNDNLKVSEMFDSIHDHPPDYSDVINPDFKSIRKYLGQWFEEEQLAMIECAFERGAGEYTTDSKKGRIMAEHFKSHLYSDTDLMRAIMENIVKNEGKFVPAKWSDSTFRRHGYNPKDLTP